MKPIEDPLIIFLQKIIHVSVRLLAVLMTFVIFWGVFDVIWELYQRLRQPPFMLLDISDILVTFGVFLAVLIAIEIFINITVYLKEEVIQVKIVLATALMAIARKVIIFDYTKLEPQYIYATAAVVLALSIGYWLVIVYGDERRTDGERLDPGAIMPGKKHSRIRLGLSTCKERKCVNFSECRRMFRQTCVSALPV